jgi:DNA polymerase-3 subunit alpha
VPLGHIDEEFIDDFNALLEGNTGQAELHFLVQDEDGQMYVNLRSRKRRITVKKELISYIKERTYLSYKIN